MNNIKIIKINDEIIYIYIYILLFLNFLIF